MCRSFTSLPRQHPPIDGVARVASLQDRRDLYFILADELHGSCQPIAAARQRRGGVSVEAITPKGGPAISRSAGGSPIHPLGATGMNVVSKRGHLRMTRTSTAGRRARWWCLLALLSAPPRMPWMSGPAVAMGRMWKVLTIPVSEDSDLKRASLGGPGRSLGLSALALSNDESWLRYRPQVLEGPVARRPARWRRTMPTPVSSAASSCRRVAAGLATRRRSPRTERARSPR